jgi:hypothetical protein
MPDRTEYGVYGSITNRPSRRGRFTSALAVLAIVSVLGAGVGGRILAGPAASPSPSASSNALAVGSPTPTPRPDRRGSPPGTPKIPDDSVLQTIRDLDVSDTGATFTIPGGSRLFVVDAVGHFGRLAYEVQLQPDAGDPELDRVGRFGLVEEDQLLAATTTAELACPSRTVDLRELMRLAPFERLACYQNEELDLRSVFARTDPAAAESLVLTADGTLSAASLPVAGGLAPRPDQWLDILGHFDDPAAAGCAATDAIGITRCREQFVLSSVVPAQPPATIVTGEWFETDELPLAPRGDETYTWTGTELIVWGGTGVDAMGALIADGTPAGAAYKPATGSWRGLPDWRLGQRSGSVVGWAGNRFVVVGGSRDPTGDRPLRTGAVYDPAANRWRAMAPSLDAIPANGRVATSGRELVVGIGGNPESASAIAFQAYDPRADRWRRLPSLDVPALGGWTIATDGDKVVAIGQGGDQGTLVWALDRNATHWRTLPALVTAGLQVDGVVVGGNAVFPGTAVGVTDAGGSDMVAMFDLATEQWTLKIIPYSTYSYGGVAASTGSTAVFSLSPPVVFDPSSEQMKFLVPPPVDQSGAAFITWTGDRLIWVTDRGLPDQRRTFLEFRPTDPAELLHIP